MMSIWLLSALAALQPTPATDPCAVPEACRRVTSVRLQAADGKETIIPINQTLPWVVQDNMMLVPGDWIIVRLVQRDGFLAPVLVRAGTDAAPPAPGDGEIRFRIKPYDKGGLTMEALSRRPETLDYAALMVTPKGPQRTSVCSLMPGITVFEAWQQPIRQFALWSFRPTTEPGCKTIDSKKKQKIDKTE